MTSLVSTDDVRALVKTSLTDVQLQAVIDRIEADITSRIGAPQDDEGSVELTETLEGGMENLFVRREVSSVSSIVEDTVTLTATDYRTWAGGVIERLPEDTHWGDVCVVTYKPTDERPQRTQAIIDLARLVIERTAMGAESVAGEYSYTAPPNWEAELRRVIRRLTFVTV
jgi:hypothetical protein